MADTFIVDPLPDVFVLAGWRVLRDQNRLENLVDGAVTRLEPKAMEVLCLLAIRAGRTVTREELLDTVWRGRYVVEGTLSRVIVALRAAFNDSAKAPTVIETVTKRGYRLLVAPRREISEVETVEPANSCDATHDEAATIDMSPPRADAMPPPVELRDGVSTPRVVGPSRSARKRHLPVAVALALAVTFVGWLGWSYGRLERATSSGLDAMQFRGEAPGDRAALRAELETLRSGRVLWVDDAPEGNSREIRTLEQAGLIVDLATNNTAAAERMRGREYDLLISDVRRVAPELEYAGLDLPRVALPDRNRLPPLIYYVGRVSGSHTREGYPITSRPSELFRHVAEVIRWRHSGGALEAAGRALAIAAAPGRATPTSER